jgi:hypothetical protein
MPFDIGEPFSEALRLVSQVRHFEAKLGEEHLDVSDAVARKPGSTKLRGGVRIVHRGSGARIPAPE